MSRQYWTEPISWLTTTPTSVANTTTESLVYPNITVPANYTQDGRAFRVRAMGSYSNVVTAVPTLKFFVRWGGVGGTILCASFAIQTGTAAVTNGLFDLNFVLQTRSNGATGTIMANGTASLYGGVAPQVGSSTGASADSAMTAGAGLAPAAVTVDLTADTALAISCQWSAANAANSVTGTNYVLESLN